MSLHKAARGRNPTERQFRLLLYVDCPRDAAIITALDAFNIRERQIRVKEALYAALGCQVPEPEPEPGDFKN